jgi:metallo-beta-lactamase family protein
MMPPFLGCSGMRISFHGAAREVTGSCHLVETAAGNILLDCGMIQGGRERHERNREPFRFRLDALKWVVLSHAHIDHSGRLPLLADRGYRGPIICTEATERLCRIMLADSGRIQEEDARWAQERARRKGESADRIAPLYTEAQALAVLDRFVAVPFDRWVPLGDAGRLRFHMAGHILGAGIVELELDAPGRPLRLVFSGDLGIRDARLLSGPAEPPTPDVLVMESTYGDRDRVEEPDRTELLYELIESTLGRRGKLVIPSFAVGRTQEILARLNDLAEAGRLPGIRVYVDSPMAVAATGVFASSPESWSEEARRLYHAGDAPLEFPGLGLIISVEDSKALNASRDPAVIISASGMCTAGRIKHHLAHTISDSANTVLFVGYQARGTLGSAIESGMSPVRIHGAWYPVRARIERIQGFSAHADREELIAWFEGLGGPPRQTYLVHGEPEAAIALGRELRSRFGAETLVPERGDTFALE